MSTKSTIILTGSNEHWYLDCVEVVETNGKYRDTLYMEFSGEHTMVEIGSEGFTIRVHPQSNLYKALEEKGLI